jgi:HEAT repeat protein/S1-C subfamily serine protease
MTRLNCPKCRNVMTVDADPGEVVKCDECGVGLRVPKTAAPPARSSAAVTRSPAKPVPAKNVSPPKKVKPIPEEDEEDEDEVEEKPRKVSKAGKGNKAGKGGSGGKTAVIAVALVAVLGAAGAGVYFFTRPDDKPKSNPPVAQRSNPGPSKDRVASDRKPDNNPPDTRVPTEGPPKDGSPSDPPVKAGGGPISSDKIYPRLLRAAVFILNRDSLGSGSVIHVGQRLILTNYHVVEENPKVLLFFPMREGGELVTSTKRYIEQADTIAITGRVVARNKNIDLALVQADSLPSDVRPLFLAPRGVQPGENIHSCGASGAQQGRNLKNGTLWRYTFGQVRSAGQFKEILYEGGLVLRAYVVETQAAINPGDSGSGAINDRGQMVGVQQGLSTKDRLVSMMVDLREIRKFVGDYLTANNLRWEAPTGSDFEARDLPGLVRALSGTDAGAALEALKELGELGPSARAALPSILHLLGGTDDAIKLAARLTLKQLRPLTASEVQPLTDCLTDKSHEVRLAAVEMLGELGAEARNAADPLAKLLADSDSTVRVAAIRTLGKLGEYARPAIPALVDLITRDRGVEARAASETLSLLGTPDSSIAPKIRALLKDTRAEVRLAAASALVRLGGEEEAQTEIARLICDPDPGVRERSYPVLSRLPDETLAKIAPRLKDKVLDLARELPRAKKVNQLVLVKLIVGLGADAAPAIPALTDLLSNREGDREVAGVAASALVKVASGDRKAVNALVTLFEKGKADRDLAIKTLVEMGTPAVSQLCFYLTDRSVAIRLATVETLDTMGGNAKGALIHLLKCKRDPDPRVREAANRAWVKIQRG